MPDKIIPQNTHQKLGETLLPEFLQLLQHLHRGGAWGYWWTFPGKSTTWWPVGTPGLLPSSYQNIYFGVHPTKGKGGKQDRSTRGDNPKNAFRGVTVINCLFAEFDAKDFQGGKNAALDHVQTLDIPPSVVIDSGGGYHAYWLLDTPFELATDADRQRAIQLQRNWVDRVRGDSGAKDIARVLRVPGTLNHKYSPAPTVAFQRVDLSLLYSLTYLESWADEKPPTAPAPATTPQVKNSPSTPANNDTDLARAALDVLDPWRCSDYHEWIRIGLALKHGLGPAGLPLWDAWSSSSSKYIPGEIAKRWESLGEGPVNISTLFWAAEHDRPGWRDEHNANHRPAPSNNGHKPQGAATAPAESGKAPASAPTQGNSEERRKYPKGAEYVAFLARAGYTFSLCALDDSLWVNGSERMTDPLEAEIKTLLRDNGFQRVNVAADAWLANARANAFHPIRDYLNALTWDGMDHIGQLATYIDDRHENAPLVLRKWLLGTVARVMTGGRQNRVLVLEGKQGCGKSYLARWIASPLPAHFSESMPNPDDKDSRLSLATTWIWEIKELGAVTRRADRESLKAWLTLESITERPAYGRHPIHKPAITSFIATVNNEGGFFNDPTGSRRYMTIAIDAIDWGYPGSVNVDQVWAQAASLFHAGEDWNLTPEEATIVEAVNDEYEFTPPVHDWLDMYAEPDSGGGFLPASEILDAIKMAGVGGSPTGISREVAGWMKRNGYEDGRGQVALQTLEGTTTRRVRGYYGVKLLKRDYLTPSHDGQMGQMDKWDR